MYRRFIATIAAASIAITALGTTPAFAERHNDDLARALAIILGAAVVGKVIHDNKKKKKKRNQAQQHYDQDYVYEQPRPRRPRHVQPDVYQHPHAQPHVQPRPLPRAVNRHLRLPQRCFRSYQGRGGQRQMFGLRCLQNNYAYTNSLPQHCFAGFKTPNGKRRGYKARCLYREGYRLAHR